MRVDWWLWFGIYLFVLASTSFLILGVYSLLKVTGACA